MEVPTSISPDTDSGSAPYILVAEDMHKRLRRKNKRAEEAVEALAGEIVVALKAAPHFVRLRGLAAAQDQTVVAILAQAIAGRQPTRERHPTARERKISFTQVRIDPDKATTNARSTAYSRTNQPLELHTDSSYKAVPHELVAFQIVRSDASGGDTVMMPVETILDHLHPDVRDTLSAPIYPFGKGKHPVLWQTAGRPQIRYYRKQIDNAVENGASLPGAALEAMDILDAVLSRTDLQTQFHLDDGEILFMDNTRVLHGRTGFGAKSDRLMYRIRIEAECLA